MVQPLLNFLSRQFSTWLVSHHVKDQHISLEDDVPVDGELLPRGSPPIWLDVPRLTTHLEILKQLDPLLSSVSSVTVLCWPGDQDSSATLYCREKKWSYRDLTEMAGCEDEAIVAIDCMNVESITRAHNLLVVVTTPGAK